MLPDFSEFLEENTDRLDQEIGELPLEIIQATADNPDDIAKASALFGEEITRRAVKISLLYLRAYHDWLNEILS